VALPAISDEQKMKINKMAEVQNVLGIEFNCQKKNGLSFTSYSNEKAGKKDAE
jgi:hypothetical protein